MTRIKKITQSKFIRNVAIVATGTAMAQSISVIFAPIITRIYGPEAFGLMGTFVSMGTIAAAVSAFAYPFAIVLPKKDIDAMGIAKLSVYISITTASIAAIILLAAGDWIFALLGAQAITAFAMLIPVKMLFAAWLRVAQQWFIRKKKFKESAKIEVIKSFIINGGQAAIGWFNPIAAVLIILATLEAGVHSFLLYFNFIKNKKKKKTDNHNPEHTPEKSGQSLKQLAKKYYDFPLYRAPVIFIDAVSSSLPVLMLSAFFGPVSAGYYVLCHKVLKGSTKLIGRAVANVFYPKITETAHKGKNVKKLILQATFGMAGVGFLPYLIIIAFGPQIFSFVFGEEWIMAGEYARWMALFVFFDFISSPSTVATATLGLQRGFLVYEILSTSFKLAVLYAGFTFFHNEVITIAAFSVSGVAALILLMYWVIHSAGNLARNERFED